MSFPYLRAPQSKKLGAAWRSPSLCGSHREHPFSYRGCCCCGWMLNLIGSDWCCQSSYKQGLKIPLRQALEAKQSLPGRSCDSPCWTRPWLKLWPWWWPWGRSAARGGSRWCLMTLKATGERQMPFCCIARKREKEIKSIAILCILSNLLMIFKTTRCTNILPRVDK